MFIGYLKRVEIPEVVLAYRKYLLRSCWEQDILHSESALGGNYGPGLNIAEITPTSHITVDVHRSQGEQCL